MRSATRKRTGKDPAYLIFVRSLSCVCCDKCSTIELMKLEHDHGNTVCLTEAAHTGKRGLSQKAPDREAIPLCKWHHTEGPESHHRLGKAFWNKWGIDRDELIAELQSRYEKEKECR